MIPALRAWLPDAGRRDWIIFLAGSAVLVVYLYQGYPAFYDAHIAPFAGPCRGTTGCTSPGSSSRRCCSSAPRRRWWRVCCCALRSRTSATYPFSKLGGLSPSHYLAWEATYLLFCLGWEAFFRGFLQPGLRERMGAFGAMALQTLVSTVAHPGRPQGEMAAAVVAGVGFGALALRTGSWLWPCFCTSTWARRPICSAHCRGCERLLRKASQYRWKGKRSRLWSLVLRHSRIKLPTYSPLLPQP